jgi:hypothetical protein
VPGASHLLVTKDARPGRILLAEQQVLSDRPWTATQLHRRLRVAPELVSSLTGLSAYHGLSAYRGPGPAITGSGSKLRRRGQPQPSRPTVAVPLLEHRLPPLSRHRCGFPHFFLDCQPAYLYISQLNRPSAGRPGGHPGTATPPPNRHRQRFLDRLRRRCSTDCGRRHGNAATPNRPWPLALTGSFRFGRRLHRERALLAGRRLVSADEPVAHEPAGPAIDPPFLFAQTGLALERPGSPAAAAGETLDPENATCRRGQVRRLVRRRPALPVISVGRSS